MLTLVVEDMFLLAVQVLDRKAIHGQLGVFGHPLLDGRERDPQQLGIEPGGRLRRLCEQDLHLLTLGVDLVVALILVVAERGEVPDLVLELADVVAQFERREQCVRTARQRPLQRGERRNLPVEVLVRRIPGVPVGKNICEIPFETIGNLVALEELRRCCGFGGTERVHRMIILHDCGLRMRGRTDLCNGTQRRAHHDSVPATSRVPDRPVRGRRAPRASAA